MKREGGSEAYLESLISLSAETISMFVINEEWNIALLNI